MFCPRPARCFAFFALFILASSAKAGDLDTIGATLLWQVDPTLKGNSVPVAQAEASSANNPPNFEINPASVGQPTGLLTWMSALGSGTTFPNSIGAESAHANLVAANFFGLTTSPAPQVAHVDNYDAEYFYNNIIAAGAQPSIPGRIVNQSFVFSAGEDATVDPQYDNYAAHYGTLFCSGVGNGGNVLAPRTSYNGLGVGLYGFAYALGPTWDGRCKPDLVAPDAAQFPGSANSFSIPYVSGSAAVLIQAGVRGDAGADTAAAATNQVTLKALLLNGAIKPSDWTNSTTRPLDLRYGAGIVNLFNSWSQLKGGRHSSIESSSSPAGSQHPPGSNPNNEPALTGWDFNTITNRSLAFQQVNHYYFDLTNPSTLTATLVWNRQENQSSINDLNLFLYNVADPSLVASSVSSLDNVEHIVLTSLPPGRYDLQVQKSPASQVSPSETYALAFEFFSLRLNIFKSGSDLVISWPLAPTGFRLYSTPALAPASWSPINASVTSNSQNIVTIPTPASSQFFRLQRP